MPLSQWFLLVSGFGSLFIVAGKRYSELHTLGSESGTRRSLVRYTDTYLRFVWSTAAGATVISYSLWAFEQAPDTGVPWHTISIAPFVMGLLRYAVDVDAGTASEPEDIVFRDRVLQLIGLAWLVTVCLGVLVGMTPLADRLGPDRADRRHLVEASCRRRARPAPRRHPDRGLIARGLGRSYGDAAQNAGGTVLAPIAGPTTISRAGDGAPLVTAAAGTSLHDLMATLLAERLFVPVTPGTRYVTVGGAVAADIHGKNHHRDGTFGEQVVSLDLVTADGGLHTIGPDADPALFWATVGGMGLTGVITSVTLRALPVESAYVTVHTERIAGLGRADADDAGPRRRPPLLRGLDRHPGPRPVARPVGADPR